MTDRVTADIHLTRMRILRERIFDIETQDAVLKTLRTLSQEDYYLDLRDTSEGKLRELIDGMISMPLDAWRSFLKTQPVTLLGFMYDRFVYAESYLEGLKKTEIVDPGDDRSLIRWGLIDLWMERDLSRHP